MMFCKRCGVTLRAGRCPRCMENWRGPVEAMAWYVLAVLLLPVCAFFGVCLWLWARARFVSP